MVEVCSIPEFTGEDESTYGAQCPLCGSKDTRLIEGLRAACADSFWVCANCGNVFAKLRKNLKRWLP